VVAGATILYQIGDGRNPLRGARMRAVDGAGTDIRPERRLSILLLVVAAHHRMGQLVERELAADGVMSADYALLSLVGLRGPARLTEVAAELGMPLTTASDAVKRLEARGYAHRSRNPDDGRSVLVELTEAGNDEWRRGWPALRRVNEQLMGALEDPELVRAGLERLGGAFEQALAGAPSKEATKS
jgi:DNA-binding MarR family transcriptional regulator